MTVPSQKTAQKTISGLKGISIAMPKLKTMEIPKLKTMEGTKLRTPTKELTRIMEGTKLRTPTKERTIELTRLKIPERTKLKLPKTSSIFSNVKQKKGKSSNYFKFMEITPVGELINFTPKKTKKKNK